MQAKEEVELSAEFPVTPQVLYEAWLVGELHTAMTGAPASGEARLGAPFSAWDGYIWGENLELQPAHRIVQSWSSADFPEGSQPSRLEIRLQASPGGTRLELFHSHIPAGQGATYRQGWHDYYLEPMGKYFTA